MICLVSAGQMGRVTASIYIYTATPPIRRVLSSYIPFGNVFVGGRGFIPHRRESYPIRKKH